MLGPLYDAAYHIQEHLAEEKLPVLVVAPGGPAHLRGRGPGGALSLG